MSDKVFKHSDGTTFKSHYGDGRWVAYKVDKHFQQVLKFEDEDLAHIVAEMLCDMYTLGYENSMKNYFRSLDE